MWPGDDIDPLASPSSTVEDRGSVLLQVNWLCCLSNKKVMMYTTSGFF